MKKTYRITWIVYFLLTSICLACSENTIYIEDSGIDIPDDNNTPSNIKVKGHFSLNGLL